MSRCRLPMRELRPSRRVPHERALPRPSLARKRGPPQSARASFRHGVRRMGKGVRLASAGQSERPGLRSMRWSQRGNQIFDCMHTVVAKRKGNLWLHAHSWAEERVNRMHPCSREMHRHATRMRARELSAVWLLPGNLFGLMTNLPHFICHTFLPKVSSSIRTTNLRQSVTRLATNQTAHHALTLGCAPHAHCAACTNNHAHRSDACGLTIDLSFG
jgi:hypothetical protein